MRWPGCPRNPAAARRPGTCARSRRRRMEWNTTPRADDADRIAAAAGARPRGRGRAARQAPQARARPPPQRGSARPRQLRRPPARRRPAGRAPPGRRAATLTIQEPGAPPRQVEVRRRSAIWRASCPTARCGGGCARCSKMRALLPVVRLRSSVLPLAVVDGDGKTVVRLVIERAEAVADRARRAGAAADGRAGARLRRRPRADAAGAARAARARDRGAPGVRRGGRGDRRAPRWRLLEAEGRARSRHARRRGRRRGARPARRDRRGERPRHDRRPRHRVPPRPARGGAARPRGPA